MDLANFGIPFRKNKKPSGIDLNSFTLFKSDEFEREIPPPVLITGTANGRANHVSKLDTGQSWLVTGGTWVEDDTGFYLYDGGSGWRACYFNSGLFDGILECDITWNSACGLMFRGASDVDASGNFNFLLLDGTYATIREVIGWADSLVNGAEIAFVAGQTYRIKLKCLNNNIALWVNDVLIFSIYMTNNLTGPMFGLFSYGLSYTNRWNAIKFTDPGMDVTGKLWNKEYNEGKASLSTLYARTGTKSLRMELKRTDPLINGSKRCEISRKVAEAAREEHWYMFSVYLPDGGDDDYKNDPSGSEIIAQWHGVPDEGEDWIFPPLALRTKGNKGKYFWQVDIVWDTNALSTEADILANKKYATVNLGSYLPDKGKWTDWAFHVRWGWLSKHKPILEVYKNGQKVCERNGLPNMTNDAVGVVQKLGIYKWDWAQVPDIYSAIDKRVVYYDAVKDYKK